MTAVVHCLRRYQPGGFRHHRVLLRQHVLQCPPERHHGDRDPEAGEAGGDPGQALFLHRLYGRAVLDSHLHPEISFTASGGNTRYKLFLERINLCGANDQHA